MSAAGNKLCMTYCNYKTQEITFPQYFNQSLHSLYKAFNEYQRNCHWGCS